MSEQPRPSTPHAGNGRHRSPADVPCFDPTAYGNGPDDWITDMTENAAITHHAIQIGSVQNGACNVNVGNDALNIGSPHKNKVNQKKSCNAKNTVKGG